MAQMTIKIARLIVGNVARWELVNMKRALEMFPLMNDEAETERLEAVKLLLADHE